MATTQHRHSKPIDKRKLWSLLVLLLFMFFAWSIEKYGIPGQNISSGPNSAIPKDGTLRVWYTDIGQADSILIQTPAAKNILIDAGEASTGEELVQWLKKRGVKKLDVLIATHPHSDHIGGMASVIEAFPVEKFYMSKIASDQIPTTRVYESMLEALSERGTKATAAKAGMKLYSEEGLLLTCLSPISKEYNDYNDYSIVTRLEYGNKNFLFMGDAETLVEKEILDSKAAVRADVLKCGHHGSSTSSSKAFLKKVDPSCAVISCGVGNDYGHPHDEILKRLENRDITYYRTDTQGTILAICDGNTISFQTEMESVKKD